MYMSQEIGTCRKGQIFWLNSERHKKLSSINPLLKSETTAGPLRSNTMIKLKFRDEPVKKIRPIMPEHICYAIANGTMERCCSNGCVECNFIGWKGMIKKNKGSFKFMKTGQYAQAHDISLKTVQRHCDMGRLNHFKLRGLRYIIK